MSKLKVLGAAACASTLLLSATPSVAEDGRFLFIGSDDVGAGFVDLGSLTAGPQPVVKMLYLPRRFTVGDHHAVYLGIAKLRVNCPARTTALISAKAYSDVGDLVEDEGPQAAKPVDPSELPAVNTLRVACKLPGAPSSPIFSSSMAAIKWWRLQ